MTLRNENMNMNAASKLRWNEKAGLLAGCVKLPIGNALEGAKGDRLMKKNSNLVGSLKRKRTSKSRKSEALTIGLDLGDKMSHYCVLGGGGE